MYKHQIRNAIDITLSYIRDLQKLNIISNPLTSKNRINLLIKSVDDLFVLILNRHAKIADVLKSCSLKLIYSKQYNGVVINRLAFSNLVATIEMLDSMYYSSPKFFISHSTKDAQIVKAFVEKILLLGCGFNSDDIYCTLDTSAIPVGEEFRNDIIENMRKCDYIVLMISENYRQSEICHNEVDAAWALQDRKRILPMKFPNLSFSQDDLGVLTVVKQAASLNDRSQLMALYEEICRVYDITPQMVAFSRYVEEFITVVQECGLN